MKHLVSSRSSEEWIATSKEQAHHILGYIKNRVNRVSTYNYSHTNVRFRKGGIPFYSEEEILKQRQKEASIKELKTIILEIEDFTQLLPTIQKYLGPDATFETFLDFVSEPVHKSFW